jgi:hypothetical protein
MYATGYYTNMKSIKDWFFENNTDKEKNPYWVVYHGDSDKSKKACFNYHVSNPVESWKLLNNNIERYVESGGIFTACVSDKPKDTAASATIYIKFNPFGTQQAAPTTGIAGLPVGGDLTTYIAEKIQLAQLQTELSELKTGKSSISPLIGAFVNHPNFDPNKGLTVLAGMFHRGMDFMNGSKEAAAPPIEAKQVQALPEQQTQVPTESAKEQQTDRLHAALVTITEKTGKNPIDFLESISNWAKENDEGTIKYVLSLLQPKPVIKE